MILDVAIVVVFLIAAYGGYKAGLLSSILNIFKWVLAGVFASLLTPSTKTFLMKNTSIYDNLIPKGTFRLLRLKIAHGLSSNRFRRLFFQRWYSLFSL